MDSFRNFGLAYLRQNWLLYTVIMVVFTSGVFFGALTANNLSSQQLKELHDYLTTYFARLDQFHLEPGMLKAIIYENMLLMGVIYFLGLTFAGIPFILALVFFRGFILGFAVACLNLVMSWPGLLLATVSILPHNLLYLPALVVGGAAALSFALILLRRYSDYRIKIWSCLAGYTLIMITVVIITLGASLIEVYFSPWLTRLAVQVLALK